MTDSDRLIEVEIKLAYQEDLLQALNKIVSEQQQQIQRLEKTCQLLHERIQGLADANSTDKVVHEIPPHY
jgi:SlyX protein